MELYHFIGGKGTELYTLGSLGLESKPISVPSSRSPRPKSPWDLLSGPRNSQGKGLLGQEKSLFHRLVLVLLRIMGSGSGAMPQP